MIMEVMAAISTLKMLKMMKQKMMMLGKVDLDVFNTCSSNPTRTALLPFLVTCSYIWGKVRLKCKFGFHYTVHTFCRNLNLYTEAEKLWKSKLCMSLHCNSQLPAEFQGTELLRQRHGGQSLQTDGRMGRYMQANMLHQQNGSGSQTNVSWESRRSKSPKIKRQSKIC